jgi:hypothetical protein
MGLKAAIRRARHVYGWRLRYWWLDTRGGAEARVAALCLAVLVVVAQLIRVSIAALLPPPPGAPVQAVYWWVVQLIILAISAIIAYALRPKVEAPKPNEGQGQTTEDGQAVVRYWGTHWIDDMFLLAWKITGRDPIKGKGGK